MFILIFSLTVISLSQASPWDSLTANIAVVEYAPIFNITFNDTQNIELNIQNFLDVLDTASNKTKLDLIVFPEGSIGIATSIEMVPGDNPCYGQKEYPQFMVELSCAAINFATYLIANLVETVKCENPSSSDSENCQSIGSYFYNTDVIFDRNGTIVNRYHKYNLFGEYQFDRPEEPEVVTFETDFGIKFGIFTCFDILFKSPAQDVLAEGIDGIIYPTNWVSELPFLTALQSQEMFSYTHDTVLFAAGYNNPLYSAGGSGVHRGTHDSILQTVVAEGGSQILLFESVNGVVTPPETQDIDTLGKQMDDFILGVDNSLQNFTWAPLDTSQKHNEQQICHGNDTQNQFCCNFNISLTNNEETGVSYSYLMVAFAGLRHYPYIVDGGLEICALIACLNSTISSCGQRFPKYEEIVWPLTFDEITIKANFEVSDNKTQFPNTLLSSIRPIDANQTAWSGEEIDEDGRKMIERTFSLNQSQNRLLTFAIFGRDFGQNVAPRDQDVSDYNVDVEGTTVRNLLLPRHLKQNRKNLVNA